jgi:hypothetical protein
MWNFLSLRNVCLGLPLAVFALIGAQPVARAQTISISNLWSISTSAGRPYVTSGNTERGVAYNPLNNHVYLVSRAGTLRVAILDGDTGAELGFLDVTGISLGTFILSTINVADDGSIYGANLTTGSATTPYKIYRWLTEGSAPVNVYSGNPSGGANNNRYGDAAIDVRGSGIDTEIITAAQNNPIAVIFKPGDASLLTFTSTRVDVTGISPGDLTKGMAWGTGTTFHGKNSGNTVVRYCSYNLGAGTGTLIGTFNVANTAPIDVDPVRNLLATADCQNNTTTHNLRVYDLATGATPTSLFTSSFPAPATANANAVGQVQIAGDRIVSVDTQNGVMMAKIYVSVAPVPPSITQQPASQTVVEGGYATLIVGANGTKPLSYQWLFEGSPIPGAQTNFLNLTNITMAQAGNYSVLVTNIAGSTNSNDALIQVAPSVRSAVMTKCWELPPGSRPWITTDNNQRGLAYNPDTHHLLVVSRSPTNAIYVLDDGGNQLSTLNVDPAIINGGTFTINLIGVADDGSIYAANLTTGAAGNPFKLYRWAFEDSEIAPTVAYSGDPANGTGGATSVRWGDDMDLRGGGNGIQVILGSRAGNQAAILTTGDGGASFTSTPITTDAANGELGLGIAFGAGDTFWAKSSGTALRHIGFDLVGGTGTTLETFGTGVFPGAITTLGVDAAHNRLAGLSLETPDNVRLYDIADLGVGPVWLDTEFLATDNANANGTGSLDFGGGKLFALDSNNGLAAYCLQNAPPMLACAGDKTVECGTPWTFDRPTATDACDGTNVAIVVTGTITNLLCGNTFRATRTWMATNTCGGVSAPCSQTVTVRDTMAPVITLLGTNSMTLECHGTFADPGATASDSCAGDLTSQIVTTGSVNPNVPGTYVLHYNVSDPCTNAAVEVTRTVHVVDTVAPVITLLGTNAVTMECHGSFSDPGATASDSCAGDLTSQIVRTGSVDPTATGTYVLRYNVSDPSTNAAAEVTRTVHVVDTMPPTITCPADITRTCNSNRGVAVTFTATSSDGCDVAPAVTCLPPSGSTFGVGTTHVLCRAEDASGNRTSCTFAVTVVDPTPAPALTIEQQGSLILVSWPDHCTGFVLKETANLDPGFVWTPSAASVQTAGGRNVATFTNSGPSRFFLLCSSPCDMPTLDPLEVPNIQMPVVVLPARGQTTLSGPFASFAISPPLSETDPYIPCRDYAAALSGDGRLTFTVDREGVFVLKTFPMGGGPATYWSIEAGVPVGGSKSDKDKGDGVFKEVTPKNANLVIVETPSGGDNGYDENAATFYDGEVRAKSGPGSDRRHLHRLHEQ